MGKTIALFALVAVLFGATASLVRAELTASGNLFITFDGGILPEALPRDDRAPIGVWISGQVRTLSGETPPSLREVTIGLNRDGRLDARGLPLCGEGQIDLGSSEEALAACGDALVGTGRYRARTTFPEQAQSPSHGKILAFNAQIGGRPVILGHVYGRRAGAEHRDRRLRDHPPERHLRDRADRDDARNAHPLGLSQADQPRLRRTYTYRGERLSYLSAPCPAPRGLEPGLLPVCLRLDGLRRRAHPVLEADPHLPGQARHGQVSVRVGLRTVAVAASLCALGGSLAAAAAAAPVPLVPSTLSTPARMPRRPRSRSTRRAARSPSGRATTGPTRSSNRRAARRAEPGRRRSTSRPRGRDATEPQVAIDSAGDAVAVWSRHNGSRTSSRRRATGGRFLVGAGRPLRRGMERQRRRRSRPIRRATPSPSGPATTAPTTSSRPRLWPPADPGPASSTSRPPAATRANPRWRSTAAARRSPSGSATTVTTTSSRAPPGPPAERGPPWRTSRRPASRPRRPRSPIGPSGEAVAVWSRSEGADVIVQAAARPAGGTWSTAADLSLAGQDATTPQVAIGPSGERSRSGRDSTSAPAPSSRAPPGRRVAPGRRRSASR